jgi:membrane fusion protein
VVLSHLDISTRMTDNSIFRQEALAHRKAQWLGKAMLTGGVPAVAVVMFCVLSVMAILALLVCGMYTRRINVQAEVITQPHTIQLFAQQQGIISEQFVQAAQRVHKGQHLYQIDLGRITRSGNVSDNAVEAVQQEISQIAAMMGKLAADKTATLASLEKQYSQLAVTQKTSAQQLNNAREAMETMRQTMQNYEAYLQEGLVTKEQVSAHRGQFYQQQSAYQTLVTQVNQQQAELIKFKNDIATRSSGFDSQMSQYSNQRSELQKQLNEAHASGTLYVDSPAEGRLAATTVTTGQMVGAGDLLVQIVPITESAYQLAVWVPNDGVPYIAVNDVVRIRYDAFPFEKFGQFSGKIIALANVPSTAQEMSLSTNAPRDGQPYYKAVVQLDKQQFLYRDKALQLSGGLKAQVTLFLETRPLYQWMLAPFYDLGKGMVAH